MQGLLNKPALLSISVEDIRPNPQQPRQHFDETELHELADNIKINGLIQPIAVELHDQNPADIHFILIDGERRWRATKLAGLPTILAVVSSPSSDDEQAKERLIQATVANVQRANLSGIELARAFQQLSDQGLTDAEISRRVGLSRSRVNNLRRLLGLPEDILEDVANGRIQERQAGDLLRLFALPKPLLDATATYAANIVERARTGDSSDNLRHQITNVIRWHTYSVDKSLFADHKFGESGNFRATYCRSCPMTVRMDDGDWCADKDCYVRKQDSWRSYRLTQAAQAAQLLIIPDRVSGRPFFTPTEVARGREIVRDGCPHGALMLSYTPSSSSENDLLVEGFPDVRIVCTRSGGCPCREQNQGKPSDGKPLVEVFANLDKDDNDENAPLCPECGEYLVGAFCPNCKRKKQPLAPYVSTAVAKPAPHLDLAREAIASHLRKGNPKVWYALLRKIRPGYGYPADMPIERIQQHVAAYLTGNTVGDVEELGRRLADWGVSVKELPDEAEVRRRLSRIRGWVMGRATDLPGTIALQGNLANLEKLYEDASHLEVINSNKDASLLAEIGGLMTALTTIGAIIDSNRSVLLRQTFGSVILLLRAPIEKLPDVLQMTSQPAIEYALALLLDTEIEYPRIQALTRALQ